MVDLTLGLPHHSLVVEHDVGDPDHLRGHPDGGDIVKVGRVPAQLIVTPLLEGDTEERASGGPRSGRTELPNATFLLLLWQHPSEEQHHGDATKPPWAGTFCPKCCALLGTLLPSPQRGNRLLPASARRSWSSFGSSHPVVGKRER